MTLPNPAKVAIVAALEREVRPLIKQWRAVEREHDGRKYKFFENDRAVLVCSGIGPEAARRAAEAIINLYAPVLVQSAGFAGALDSTLKVGTVLTPICVIDARDGSRIEAGVGHWVLVSLDHPAGVREKAKLAEAYWAHAVDMEAAAVARAAQAHDITFVGLKVISDEADFEMPPMERFIASDGKFRTGAFAAYAALRPWLWPRCFGWPETARKLPTRFANGCGNTTWPRKIWPIPSRTCIPALKVRVKSSVPIWRLQDNP